MKKLTLFFVLGFFVLKSFCNGGPIDGSAVYSTGDIVLINNPDIKLLKEDLLIHAYQDCVKIEKLGDIELVERAYVLYKWQD